MRSYRYFAFLLWRFLHNRAMRSAGTRPLHYHYFVFASANLEFKYDIVCTAHLRVSLSLGDMDK
jgi:hypothetical protein